MQINEERLRRAAKTIYRVPRSGGRTIPAIENQAVVGAVVEGGIFRDVDIGDFGKHVLSVPNRRHRVDRVRRIKFVRCRRDSASNKDVVELRVTTGADYKTAYTGDVVGRLDEAGTRPGRAERKADGDDGVLGQEKAGRDHRERAAETDPIAAAAGSAPADLSVFGRAVSQPKRAIVKHDVASRRVVVIAGGDVVRTTENAEGARRPNRSGWT